MPLLTGNSDTVKSANIRELMHTGKYPQRQAVAIALNNAHEHPRAAGGIVGKALHLAGQQARGRMADGGTYTPPHPSFSAREDVRDILNPTGSGVINSEIPGRTDHIPLSVAADSYVIPADVVSGLGEGNTLGGARIFDEALSTAPHGIAMPKFHQRDTIPRGVQRAPSDGNPPQFAAGGNTHGPVKIIAAGGEKVVPPESLAYHPLLGGLDPNDRNPAHIRRALNLGHEIMDAWVKLERKKHIKTLQKLPGPKKD